MASNLSHVAGLSDLEQVHLRRLDSHRVATQALQPQEHGCVHLYICGKHQAGQGKPFNEDLGYL